MAPTVCLSEFCERFTLEDRLRDINPSPCPGQRRTFLLRKKPPGHSQLIIEKLRMGLVVEECFRQQSGVGADSPSLNCDHPSNSPRRDSLVHITLRTLALLRRNQRLQYRLNLLQAETRAFVESVLASPSSPSTSH